MRRGVPPTDELRARLHAFRRLMDAARLAGFLVTDEANVRYLSGFTGNDSALLVTRTHRFLLTDFRYVEEAAQSARGWRVVLKPADQMERAARLARKLRLRTLGIETEAKTLGQFHALRQHAGVVRLQPKAHFAAELRRTKSAWEVRQIERAVAIQEAAFKAFCRWLRPNVTERDAGAELRYRLVRLGAEDEAFDTLCQFDANASLPHGRPGHRPLRADSLVLLDWGACFAGYHSDLTRTFFMGRIPPRLRQIHEVVREAQARAKAAVAPGVQFRDVDHAARSVIRQAGYGPQFGHSTGHGIGLRVHEGPRLSARAEGVLEPGMVVTVEPGIYVPGVGGVRIEDDVLVTRNGHRVLSSLPRGPRWHGRDE